MEAYTLDSEFRRIGVIDVFESFIWNERVTGYGDFELVIHATDSSRRLLTAGTRLTHNETKRVMTVETIENKQDSEGRLLLTVKGRSLEATLEDRAATQGLQGLIGANENWLIEGTPAFIARYMFQKICVEGLLNPGDVMPFITMGSIDSPGTIPEPDTHLISNIPVSTLYKAIKDICDAYDLGFRILRNMDTSQLFFDIFTGSDRTTRQSDLNAVVFSPDLDNMSDINEMTSIAQYKNVAYVFSKNGFEIVYAVDADPSAEGFERKVLVVNADNVDDDTTGALLTTILKQKGLEALAAHRGLSALDGEISQNGAYKYGIDYELGDLVEMRNNDSVTNYMRVTEQIFTSDAQGDRSYPTLITYLHITPKSWISWDSNKAWDEVEETWDEV